LKDTHGETVQNSLDGAFYSPEQSR
jgi:hypothetical protein